MQLYFHNSKLSDWNTLQKIFGFFVRLDFLFPTTHMAMQVPHNASKGNTFRFLSLSWCNLVITTELQMQFDKKHFEGYDLHHHLEYH